MKRKTNISKVEKKLTLVGHLAELRKRIICSAVVFILASSMCYYFAEEIIKDITGIAQGVEFVFIAPAEILLSYIKLSLIGGLIISAPFLIFQIWQFVIPGLKTREKGYILLSLLMGGLFFITGTVFAYYIVAPTMIVFFVGFQMDAIKPMISLDNYLGFMLGTIFTFGAVFEMPILMVLLTRFEILKVSFLKKNRKFIILLIFVLAAILTPPDIVSQIILAGPMILLAEIGIFFSSLVERKKKKKEVYKQAA